MDQGRGLARCRRFRSALVVGALLLAATQVGATPPKVKAGAGAQKATLLLASDVACTVKLDGEKVADLVPDTPTKLEVVPGEYLVSAATPDGQKWSKAVEVKAPKTVVKVEFAGGGSAGSSAPRAAPSAPSAPASKGVAVGTLLVFADAPIELEIDGKAAGSLSGTPEAPGKRAFMLTPGKHFLKAVSQESSEVSAAADVQIRDGSQEIVRAMVADQIGAARAAETARVEIESAKARIRELDLRWVNIPAGKFRMGCSSGDKKCDSWEKPTHSVQITKPFQMMATEVTAGQFRTWALSQGHESPEQPDWSAPDVPVVKITWVDAQAFCSTFGGRLPTEAEWEYAARGGSKEARYATLDLVAWYVDNSGRDRFDSVNGSGRNYAERLKANGNSAHPVGAKQPNDFGLYDMLGNVAELCSDWQEDEYYRQKVEIDPLGPSYGEDHVIRGGSWKNKLDDVRVSTRPMWFKRGPYRAKDEDFTVSDHIGFRCARDANSPVTVPLLPGLKTVGTSGSAVRGTGSSVNAAPAALVAEDFTVVKQKAEDARRREEDAKRQANEAARRRAEQQRLQDEAEASAAAEQLAAEDRAFRAEMGRQIGTTLGGIAQAAATDRALGRDDLTPFGIQPTPVPARPAYVAPATPSSGSRTTGLFSTSQPVPAASGARIVTGSAPPAPPSTPALTLHPAYAAAVPVPVPTPPRQLPCYVNQQQYCTIIRLVNRSGGQIDQAYVNSDQAGGLRKGESFDKIHDPLPEGVAIDAFTSTGVNPGEVQKVEWHLSLRGPLSPCQGYTVYLELGGAWIPGPSFTKACVR